MPSPKELALTPAELDALMLASWNMRVATRGPGARVNLTPLYFGWAGGKIYFYCRGQKVANLRRDPVATVLVDANERFPELKGAMFQGRAVVLEDAAAEAGDRHLEEVRQQWGPKYAGSHGADATPRRNEATARGRHWRWVRFEPERTVTWDNTKLKR
ncbi:MAG: pyridoxamine 5'-phosphate oxidase family protein [Dehalococcoidia bacterium]|nr:pyridoxamine 5'-phosphate oxidase family protein [Dehalococcoidia bacterium]